MYTDAPATVTTNADSFFSTGNQTAQPIAEVGSASAPELTPCCNAPFYAKTLRFDENGNISQDGKKAIQVRSCQGCGHNYPKDTARPSFVIDTEEKADWLLGKLAAIRAEQKRIQANTAARVAELEADYNRLTSRFGQELEAFARAESEKRRRKTVTLQQGTLAFRTVAEKLTIDNLETAKITARAVCPSAFTTETVEKFNESAFLAHALDTLKGEAGTGEILPGVKKIDAREAFTVKVGE